MREPSAWGGLGKRFVPPLAAFAIARMVVQAAGASADPSSWVAEAWAKWDSGLYIDIAKRGYELVPCPGEMGELCGNAGWMPGFPWLMRPFIAIGLDPALAGAALAAAFAVAFLLAIWIGWLGEDLSASSLGALVVVALAPGAVYQHAVFPISMLLFLLALHGALAARDRWPGACLTGIAAALTYTTGFLVGAADVLAAPVRGNWPTRVKVRIALGVAAAAGFAAVLVLHQVQLGRWDAMFLVHGTGRWRPGLHSPIATLAAFLQLMESPDPEYRAIGFQILSSLAFVVLALVGALASIRSRGPTLDRFAAAVALVFLLVPLSLGTDVSPVRAEALLAPAGVLLRWLPRWVIAGWLVVAVWTAWGSAAVFFQGHLV